MHLLTVALEDYYHASALQRIIEPGRWGRFERRVEIGTERTLELLDQHDIKATFFVLGWVAETIPELIRTVASRGHEIASKGYGHRGFWQMSQGEFREDVARAQEAIEHAAGRRVLGFRVGRRWLRPEDLWALDILAESGYEYDSSLKPVFRTFAREPWRRFAHQHQTRSRTIWEFPFSSAAYLGCTIPISGGNYFRQLPEPLIRRAVANWDRARDVPFVMYFHTWELDPGQPRITAAPWYQQIRHYRNLPRMEGILRHYFARYRFESIAGRLGLRPEPLSARPATSDPEVIRVLAPPASARGATEAVASEAGPRISVVIPCFNEEAVLPYLHKTLVEVAERLRGTYRLHYIFVNDGSADGTAAALEQIFGSLPNCTVLHHDGNKGVSAAILTGIRAADTEVVCSIDCDCTYDPHQLGLMIPLLTQGVDLVTASPYHRLGAVKNVPAWRLSLSRCASACYRVVLRQKLHTYTSCFRVYRRKAILDLPLRENGFLGITELIGQVDLSGGGIVEYPAQLEVRVLGRSKMKVLGTILGHLRLLMGLLAQRVSRAFH